MLIALLVLVPPGAFGATLSALASTGLSEPAARAPESEARPVSESKFRVTGLAKPRPEYRIPLAPSAIPLTVRLPPGAYTKLVVVPTVVEPTNAPVTKLMQPNEVPQPPVTPKETVLPLPPPMLVT